MIPLEIDDDSLAPTRQLLLDRRYRLGENVDIFVIIRHDPGLSASVFHPDHHSNPHVKIIVPLVLVVIMADMHTVHPPRSGVMGITAPTRGQEVILSNSQDEEEYQASHDQVFTT